MGIRERNAGIVQLAAERVQPGGDECLFGGGAPAGHGPLDSLEREAALQDHPAFAELFGAPGGDVLHLHVGNREKLIADLVRDGVLLREVIAIGQARNGARQSDE